MTKRDQLGQLSESGKDTMEAYKPKVLPISACFVLDTTLFTSKEIPYSTLPIFLLESLLDVSDPKPSKRTQYIAKFYRRDLAMDVYGVSIKDLMVGIYKLNRQKAVFERILHPDKLVESMAQACKILITIYYDHVTGGKICQPGHTAQNLLEQLGLGV